MRPARLAIPVAIALVAPAALSGQAAPTVQDAAARAVETAVEPAIDALWNGYDADRALSHVKFIGQYWRLAGNTGFNASIDRVRERLETAGVSTAIDEYPSGARAWDFSVGTLAIVTDGGPDEVVLSRDKDRLPVCINSFSTPRGGVVAPLVDVGRGDRDADYEGKDVKGAIVVGDADPSQLWRRGVAARGAIGVVSGALPAYLNNDPPGGAAVTPRDEWDILQWSSVPYDEARQGFGFKASPRAMATLRGRLAAGPVSVRVTVASTFTEAPTRTLIAEIPGRSAPAERIVLAAHVQEPGANDNASGVATLTETAVAMTAAVKSGRLPAPERTLTFLFLNEISGSRRWIQDHPDQAKGVRYMFSFDMTGEDVAKTGGTFLIERYPDPGAVWERPWDPHSEWGRGNVRADSLKGDLINDAHLFVVRQVARRTGWVVTTNPYEGGSDHTVFGQAGVPSVLDWHFTDRYYHTNFDTPDKTSPAEMKNVGVAAGATAWLLASATPALAADIAGVVAAAGRERVALETSEGAKLVAAGTSTAQQEATIVSAWNKWYGEAVRSASRLVVGEPPPSFAAMLERLASAFEGGGGGFGRSALWFGLGLPTTSQAQPVGSSAVFICGRDQVVPAPILPSWVAIVMAGDGRLYQPCEEWPIHASDHRELRERKLIRDGVVSADDEVRWRATQAAWRNPRLSYLPALVSDRPPRGVDADQILGTSVRVDAHFLVLGDTLGGLTSFLTVYPACDAVAQVVDIASAGGRVSGRWHPGLLFHRMRDRNWTIRREAAFGIGMRLADPDLDPKLRQAALTELKACLAFERQPEVRAQILEAFGSARYQDDGQRGEAEDFLVEKTVAPAPVILGGVRALEMLLRQNPRRPVKDATLALLRGYVSYGVRAAPGQDADLDARIRRVAMIALQTVRDADPATVLQAGIDADWQVRRLVASRLNLNDPLLQGLADALARDEAFQVRYDFLSTLVRQAGQTHECAPIAAYITDPSPHVAMKAIDSLAASCTDLTEPMAQLVELASRLASPTFTATWHLPLRALMALARLQPDAARPYVKPAVEHAAWQVRAAAAGLCATFGDAVTLRTLVRDREPNVRTAALNALAGLDIREVIDPAIDVLNNASDHQLLRAAAMALKGTPAESRERVTNALLNALRRLTDRAEDPSRDPRVAILDRLAETTAPERSSDLLPFVVDFDDAVGAAAAKAFEAIVGTPPAPQPLRRRYPFQPRESELSELPKQAVIDFEEGQVTLDLLIDVAPVTVARFARIVNQGFYNGRTFHRVVPNFVVQGGSPGANEYAGATPRYMRDEVGPQAANIRGAVGISSRGPDTGDGQIFIDLVDLPRLDRDYTVFAYVTGGMEFVDRLLEGARIVSISLKK